MPAKTYYSWNGNNLLLELQVQTKASKNSVIGEYNNRLKISITTAPNNGKANEHLMKFLAKYFDVPPSQIKIIKGFKSKLKSILISNPKNNLDKFKTQTSIAFF